MTKYGRRVVPHNPFKSGCTVCLTLLAVLALSPTKFAVANRLPSIASAATQPVGVQSADGRVVCNTSGAFSQLPGGVDLFVGRGMGIGSLDDCHKKEGLTAPFLALYKMDWVRHVLIMQHYLLKPPLKTPSGWNLRSAYDPYVAMFKGELWVAFECTVPGAVSSCMAPLTPDLRTLDLTRFSVVAQGILGPHGQSGQIVALRSASAPTLLSYEGKLFIYWQVDYYDNELPENHLVSRGMELSENAGRIWGAGSGATPVPTDDSRLTVLVHDVTIGDPTADHVAVTSDVFLAGNRLFELSSIGGTGGPQVCRSTHDASPGCWRVAVSAPDLPLAPNVFGAHLLKIPSLPAEVIEYPRLIVDPTGHHFLMGYFQPPVAARLADTGPPLTSRGLLYIPFEPSVFLSN